MTRDASVTRVSAAAALALYPRCLANDYTTFGGIVR